VTGAAAVDLVVALPAHNESAMIADCLRSVGRAVRDAQQSGLVGRARIAVAAHRCTDDTADRARAVLADWPEVEPLLVLDNDAVAVGTVRTRLIERAAEAAPSDSAWVFSTDADTVVPADWITATLRRAEAAHADLVLGLADLGDWPVDRAAAAAYEEIIADGLVADGHRHAYAANLAIRLSAFRAVGGFPGLPHGEEHGLAAACRAAGFNVLSTLYPRVQTSARMPGRAPDGLGALLARLAGRVGDPVHAAS
jgi:hypothetical protein